MDSYHSSRVVRGSDRICNIARSETTPLQIWPYGRVHKPNINIHKATDPSAHRLLGDAILFEPILVNSNSCPNFLLKSLGDIDSSQNHTPSVSTNCLVTFGTFTLYLRK